MRSGLPLPLFEKENLYEYVRWFQSIHESSRGKGRASTEEGVSGRHIVDGMSILLQKSRKNITGNKNL